MITATMIVNPNIVKYSLFKKVKAPDLIVFEYFIISGVPGSLLITSRYKAKLTSRPAIPTIGKT